ncbi:hypothetical protein Slala04_21500 [Streptomyces lavendulae subsp. lavendulae]|nr:hypothetical protein Slala04_21500 [Streptomyces lavendulae subsp. lavendulae]
MRYVPFWCSGPPYEVRGGDEMKATGRAAPPGVPAAGYRPAAARRATSARASRARPNAESGGAA